MERAPTAPLDLAALGLASVEAVPSGGAPPQALGKARRRAPTGVRVEQLREYPVRSLVFEAGDSLREVADLVGAACQRLTAANVPHNLFIADCGARIFLFPNCFAERKARGQIPEGARRRRPRSCWRTAPRQRAPPPARAVLKPYALSRPPLRPLQMCWRRRLTPRPGRLPGTSCSSASRTTTR